MQRIWDFRSQFVNQTTSTLGRASDSPTVLQNNTVLRGGYGMCFLFHDDNAINNTQNTVPFIASQSSNNTTPAPAFTLANFYQGQPVVAPNTTGAVCPFWLCCEFLFDAERYFHGPRCAKHQHLGVERCGTTSIRKQAVSRRYLCRKQDHTHAAGLPDQRSESRPWSRAKPPPAAAVGHHQLLEVCRKRELQFVADKILKPATLMEPPSSFPTPTRSA
jgi:hypothetical protein